MSTFDWFRRQNLFVKSMVGIVVVWGFLIVYVPGTIFFLHEIRELRELFVAQPTKGVPAPPAGSPIIVSGGSLYVTTNWGGWYPASDCNSSATDPSLYCAPVPNSDPYILSSSGFNSSIAQLNNVSWTIQFTDTESDGKTENQKEGIFLCANATCNVNDPPDPQHYVYVRPFNESQSGWLETGRVPGNWLYIHDTSDNCQPFTSKHGGPCDVLAGANVSIAGVDSGKPVHYTCQAGSTNCWVIAGTPGTTDLKSATR